MHIMRWFRRNQKFLIAAVAVLLMITWGGLSSLSYLAREKTGTRPHILGEPVRPEDLQAAGAQLEKAQQFGLITPRDPIGSFIYANSEFDWQQPRPVPVTRDAVWRYLVLLRTAEQAGIQVTQKDIAGLVVEDAALRRAVVETMRLKRLYDAVQESIAVSDPEMWLQYIHQQQKAKIRYVEIKPGLFMGQVEATPEELETFYEEHKDTQPDPMRGVVGFQAPERVRIEYALAAAEDFKKGLSVSDEEVQKYYEENKDAEFRMPEGKPEAPEEKPEAGEEPAEETEETPPTEAPEAKPEGAEPQPEAEKDAPADVQPAGAGEEAPAAPVEPPPAEQPKPEGEVAGPKPEEGAAEPEGEKAEEQPEPRYKPLAEVKEQIAKKLLDGKAREAADKVMNRVLDDLEEVAADYVNEPMPLEQMAKRHRLTYRRLKAPGSEEWLDRQDVEVLLPGGQSAAERIFDQNLELNTHSFLSSEDGPMVVQVLGRREPEPRPLKEVEAQVREAVLRGKAYEHAKTVADNLCESAQASSLEGAVAELNVRLDKLLGKPAEEPPAEEKPDDKDEPARPAEKKEEEQPAEKKEEEQPGRLRVSATGLFARSGTYIPEMGGARPEVKKKAFELKTGELAAVAEEGRDASCYVIEKVAETAASEADFQNERAGRRQWACFMKRRQDARRWMDGLLKDNPPPEQEKEAPQDEEESEAQAEEEAE